MTWVKVCGLTEEADVAAAVAAGADAVGFVNIESSSRYLEIERVAELVTDVPVDTVLLALDLAPDAALRLMEETGVSGLQPYGDGALATARAVADAGYLVLYPCKAVPGVVLEEGVGIPLLDTPSESRLGGTGNTFDWSVTAGLADRFVLAGGLGPANVVAAIEEVHPWGVDASSGLEKSPGRKDHGMVSDFISKAKST